VKTGIPIGLDAAHRGIVAGLLSGRDGRGHWTGELSSSALSTATAVIALSQMDRAGHETFIRRGLEWLATHANADGGWGDTVRSRSNLSTTALVWAAFGATESDEVFREAVEGAVRFIRGAAGSTGQLVPAIEALYGADRTFSVPITMTLALSGRLGDDGWRRVRPLPFELAALPRGLFGALRLPVVSYALPALIAIGQVIHRKSGRWNPLRTWTEARTLRVLESIQPGNGGFLEATPLTSFVTMSLAGMGCGDHGVAQRGAAFLRASIRPDGSWPIDTNLATWVTTLSIKALACGEGGLTGVLDGKTVDGLQKWLLDQQYREVHPYTGAAPGGWSWTNLPGGVPDADDTSGALLALRAMGAMDARTREAAEMGVEWLLGLQNGDGGVPTFCRGWGTLPFDRSTPEITAHALRAWRAWLPDVSLRVAARLRRAIPAAERYLEASQRADGAWLPLWFGNESAPCQENPVHGTALVLMALPSEGASVAVRRMRASGIRFLLGTRNGAGGWGGDSGVEPTVEETSLVLSALAREEGLDVVEARRQALRWLCERWGSGAFGEAQPIGLYFARLWYFERLYPWIFATEALGRIRSDEG